MGDFPVVFATIRLPDATGFEHGVAKFTLFPDGTASGEVIAQFESIGRAKGYAADQRDRRDRAKAYADRDAQRQPRSLT